jgi:hypothetical protein
LTRYRIVSNLSFCKPIAADNQRTEPKGKKMDKILFTYKEASRRLEVRPETISDLVRVLGITSIRHPANGKAKAIDVEGLSLIRSALMKSAAVA